MRVLAATLVLTFLAPPALAQERELYQIRKEVLVLLDARHGFPGARDFMRVGPIRVVNSVLVDAASDRQNSHLIRLNAIRALEYFPTNRTRESLLGLVYVRRQIPAYKRAALRALTRAFGVQMYFEVLPFLRDPDSRVREGAAIAMAEIDDGRVKGILMNHLTHEPELNVRVSLEKGLSMIEARRRRAKTAFPRGTALD